MLRVEAPPPGENLVRVAELRRDRSAAVLGEEGVRPPSEPEIGLVHPARRYTVGSTMASGSSIRTRRRRRSTAWTVPYPAEVVDALREELALDGSGRLSTSGVAPGR